MRMHMKKLAMGTTVAALLILLSVLASCGGDEVTSSSSSSPPSPATQTGKTYPLLRVAINALDYTDPALTYFTDSWQMLYHVHTSLITYKQGVKGPEGATFVPGLAEALPEISPDERTFTMRLREGLKYSDGTEVKASDFKNTIKRLFLLQSPHVGRFVNIVGAAEFGETLKGDIPGIVIDDAARTIEIHLEQPQGDFLNCLAMVCAAPIPSTVPAKDQSGKKFIPATGPYMHVEYEPGQKVVLERNPYFTPTATVWDSKFDRLEVTMIEDNVGALQKTLDGTIDLDLVPAPLDRLGELQSKYPDHLKLFPRADTSYFFMNSRVAPFDKLEVRQAINYAIDREAISKLAGGLATPTENILPPGYAQYQKLDAYPYDLQKAKDLVKAAGAEGAKVDVWTYPGELPVKASQYMADVLQQLGFESRVKTLTEGQYWSAMANTKTRGAFGWSEWWEDYPHPNNWFDVLFNGAKIKDEQNYNFCNADFPDTNEMIDELSTQVQLTPEVNQGWAEVDRTLVVDHAVCAPIFNQTPAIFFGTNIDMSNWYYHNAYLQNFTQLDLVQ